MLRSRERGCSVAIMNRNAKMILSKSPASAVRRGVVVASGLVVLFPCSVAVGSGFSIPESSAAGLGTANAIVANPDERGAFPYNPAAMGFHEASSVSIGSVFYAPGLSVDTAEGRWGNHGADLLPTPNFQAALNVAQRWRIGLGVNVPFGLETRWRLGTFPMLSVPIPTTTGLVLPAGLDHPTQSKLEIVAVVPTATYKVHDDVSVAFGIDYYNAREAVLDTYISGLTGDGDGWGWNLSALYSSGPWSFGASYHSAPTIKIEGKASSSFPTASAVDATLDLNLPWRLQLGARYAVSDVLALEFDWSRTGWSRFDKLDVTSKATGALLKSESNSWRDASAYRASVSYDIAPSTRFRFGYAFDETGQASAYFTPRIPDNDRHLFSVGIGHKFATTWMLDAAYTFVKFKDRDFHGTKAYVPTQAINGTDAVSGDYQLSSHVFAIELSRAF